MREIKFRAFGKNSKEFLTDGKTYGWTLEQIQNIEDVNAWEFSQYTGLKDRHGKEIFEGDVVKGRETYGTKDSLEVVRWIEKTTGGNGGLDLMGWFPLNIYSTNGVNSLGDEFYDIGNCEVIGNIYENPNLLK